MNLFKKCAVFTDIHYGMRHNSPIHNQDCVDFIKWMIDEAHQRGAETCIFMGDFMHHRNSVNSHTLDYAIQSVKLLNDAFDHTYFIVGNHDMYLKESRDIASTKFTSLFPKVQFIDRIVEQGDVAFIPWLVGDEWKTVSDIKARYLFGHLELPGFKMNALIEMPDHGTLNSTHFAHQDRVFSGHFHARQVGGKVSYIGNPFGHNYSDVWDFDRGAMFMEWGCDPQYVNYSNGPKFMNMPLSKLMADPDKYLLPKSHLQVTLDADLTYEEASYLRETFITQYPGVREFKLLHNRDVTTVDDVVDHLFQSVDQIVVSQLTGIDSSAFDSAKLIEIYQGL